MTDDCSLYTLSSMPELGPMLREDVQQALDDAGGEMTSLALQNMKKLDSFLKESVRVYPFAPSTSLAIEKQVPDIIQTY
jgi:cytochrome P450